VQLKYYADPFFEKFPRIVLISYFLRRMCYRKIWCSWCSDSLRAWRSGDRIPVGSRCSRPSLWPTQPPVQCVPSLFPGVKRPERGVDHPPTYSAEVKMRVELYLTSSSGPSWFVLGWTLPLMCYRNKFVVFCTLISPCWTKFGISSVDALRHIGG
jgi:hypothetical protein